MKHSIAILTSGSLFLFYLSAAYSEDSRESISKAKRAYSLSDRALNTSYQKAKRFLDEDRFLRLQSEQRDWVADRDNRARWSTLQNLNQSWEGREENSSHFWETLRHLTDTRTKMIEAWCALDAIPAWGGYWTNGGNSSLKILALDADKIAFDLEVVYGLALNIDGWSDVAKTNDNLALCVVTLNNQKKDAWMFFTKSEDTPTLSVTSTDDRSVRFARGEFTRIRDLTEDEKNDLRSLQED